MFLPLCFALATTVAPAKAQPATNLVCPVLGTKVTEKSATVVVKGRAYRICCPPCGPKLQADPGKYLNADGTPKNAKK